MLHYSVSKVDKIISFDNFDGLEKVSVQNTLRVLVQGFILRVLVQGFI